MTKLLRKPSTINKEKSLLILIILSSSLILYYPSLNYYFFQDDWFHFNISSISNSSQFLNLFAFRTDIIAWRPISKQLFFFLNHQFFGINPLVAHLIIFAIHLLNIFLILALIARIFKSTTMAFSTSFFYATSAVHFIALSWISAGEYTIGTFFWLAASIFYVLYREKINIRFYVLSMIFFIFCLASTELALTWPAAVLLYELFIRFDSKDFNNKLKKGLILVSPCLATTALYITARLYLFPVPAKEEYAVSFDGRIVNTFFWYWLWAMNIPEVFKQQILISKLKLVLDPTFVTAFKNYALSFLISFLLFLISLSYLLIINLSRKLFKIIIFTITFSFLCLFPVLLLPNHAFPHYLIIASIGIYAFIGYLINLSKSKGVITWVALVVLFTGWFLLALVNLSFTKDTHWVSGEQDISKQISVYLKSNFPSFPVGSTVILYPTTKQDKQALMNQEALKVLYNDSSIKTVFSDRKPDLHSDNTYEIEITKK